jgi:hypothetical protein
MRKHAIPMAAAAAACLALAACGEKPAAADQAATQPEKSYGRPAQTYQGQDKVESIQSASVAPDKDGGVMLKASATVAGEGYKNPAFLPYIYAATPPDGIYEVDVVADAPATPGTTARTPIEVDGQWDKYTDGRVKGIKFISKTNTVVAMLPAAGGAEPPAK